MYYSWLVRYVRTTDSAQKAKRSIILGGEGTIGLESQDDGCLRCIDSYGFVSDFWQKLLVAQETKKVLCSLPLRKRFLTERHVAGFQ